MSRPHISMRKVRDVLRLRFGEGRSLRQVASSLQIPFTTVADHVKRAKAAGLGWPLPEDMDDGALEARLFAAAAPPAGARPTPDWPTIHRELRRPGVTLMLLWLEYKETFPDGYAYSQFCEHYRRWRRHLDVVMRQEHKAGEKLFVDFPGQQIPIYDERTGAVAFEAELFVAVLGASSYLYAEALRSQELLHWVSAHCNTFEHLQEGDVAWSGAGRRRHRPCALRPRMLLEDHDGPPAAVRGQKFPRFSSFSMSMSRAWSATIFLSRLFSLRELLELLGVVGLHAAVLVAPAVPGRLGNLEVPGHLLDGLALGQSFSPSASLRITCSGVCRRCFMCAVLLAQYWGVGLAQRVDQFKGTRSPPPDGRVGQRAGQERLAGPRGAHDGQVMVIAHPGALGQSEDLGPVEPALAAEVDVFDDGVGAQLGRLQVALTAPVLAFGQLAIDQEPEAFFEGECLVLG